MAKRRESARRRRRHLFSDWSWKRAPNSTNAIRPDGRQTIIEFPAPDRIPGLMEKWLARFNSLRPETEDDALEAYAGLHLEFVSIHPFFDGNGRVARLASNLPVLRAGAPPVVVPNERKFDYLRAIEAYPLSIWDFPNVVEFPLNSERAAFTSLCRGFAAETLSLVAAARQLQTRRDAR